ncbi:MAG: TIGR00730 family Rossman fold protein [Acidimicrobiales bacterium]
MSDFSRVCVFCASSPGADPAITEATVELGRLLVERDLELVYGGGAVGLMGLIADTVMEHGGRVTGVIPRNLFSREVGHTDLTVLEEVDTMHVRKARMYDLADAFIALPGGFGTLEELAETLTWNQIGLLKKPVGVLDVGGFWQPLLHLLDSMVDKEILKPANRDVLLAEESPAALLDALEAQDLTYVPKWIGDGEI